MSHELTEDQKEQQRQNSLGTLMDNLTTQHAFGGAPASQTDTAYYNLRWYLISNNRQLLSQLYVEHGIVQTLVDQPVDDAFRAGFNIKSGQLDGNQIEEIQRYLLGSGALFALKQGLKWTRLYGGGGVLFVTGQDPQKPLDIAKFKKDSPILFQPVDMWELYQDKINIEGDMHPQDNDDEFYHYYGKRVHKSRIMKFDGKAAPSFIRPRLRGWGMSEVERMVRSINQYMKNQDVIFELLDEAKVDVYKIDGFNTALINANGTQAIQKRIQMSNLIKNYLNAITMDMKDEYEQKQMNFSGLDAMLTQVRIQVASDVKMPVSKLFGVSQAGLGSGEDEIENYNSMIEGEVRGKCKEAVLEMIEVACQVLFNFIPDDMDIEWGSLRILNAVDEEKVKDSKMNRVTAAFQAGIIDVLMAKKSINKDRLLPVEIPEDDEVYTPPTTGDEKVDNNADGNNTKDEE